MSIFIIFKYYDTNGMEMM